MNVIFLSRYVTDLQQTQLQQAAAAAAATVRQQQQQNDDRNRLIQERALQERAVQLQGRILHERVLQERTMHHPPLIIPTHMPLTHDRTNEKNVPTMQNTINSSVGV